jgi:hypothetical protein
MNGAIRLGNGWLLALGCLLLGSCATDPNEPTTTLGASVRYMIEVQTEDADADAPRLDGQTAEAVLSAYRGDVADRKTVEQDLIEFRLGK